MSKLSSLQAYRSRGSALLIVLAFLLLLTTLSVAFLSRATLEREMSNASYSQSKTDLVAQGCVASILTDLQQEIIAGSNTGTPSVASGYFYPNSPLTAVPALAVPGYTSSSIVGTGMENLLKVSKNGQAFWPSGSPYGAASVPRASGINTSSNPSLNNRSVTAKRWNAPLLLAKQTGTSTTDYTPVAAFPIPDWIYVARDSSNPTSWNSSYNYVPSVPPTAATAATAGANPVTMRYAYAIYNEGGLLDMNVAGSPMFPVSANPTQTYYSNQPFKNSLAYADLTQLPYISTAAQTVAGSNSTVLTTAQQKLFNNAIVGWRNHYTANVTSGKFPGVGGTAVAYAFNTSVATTANTYSSLYPVTSATIPLTPFDLSTIFNPQGYLSAGGTTGGATGGKNLLAFNNNLKVRTSTDNVFGSRQQLIQFFTQGLGQNTTFTSSVPLAALQNVLQYMGTFSRDINQPSYAPPTGRPTVLATASGGNSAVGADATINPSLLNITVQSGKTFTRGDTTTAAVGEPLMKKRFALNRLCWITYKGPSAGRAQGDADIQALMSDGIPWTYLQQGTAANIQKYFGLDWDSTNFVWKYDYHNNDPTGQASAAASATGSKGPILQLSTITGLATPHEPDFFEILKATITAGSLAKALAFSGTAIPTDATDPSAPADQPYNYNYFAESSVDVQIIQIGANMIAQSQPANFAPLIVFDDGSGSVKMPRTVAGVENLPYLSMVYNGALQVQQPAPFPRNLKNAYTGSLGTGRGGDSGYQATDTLTVSGVGAFMQTPVIWNPYDPTSPPGAASPTSFRVVADSATPDQISTGTYTKFFVYGTSVGVGAGNNYSYAAASGSPGALAPKGLTSNSWYTDSTSTGTFSQKFLNPNNGHGNAEIDFTVGAPTKELCPEPIILMRPQAITDNNANSITVSVPSTAFLNNDLAIKGFVTGSGLTIGLPNFVANAPHMQAPETLDAAGQSYIGFYLGAFPLSWKPASGAPCSTSQSGAYVARYTGTAGGSLSSCFMTYRMQYADPNISGNWVTYDTKYGQVNGGYSGISVGSCDATTTNPSGGALIAAGDYAFTCDPRTSRFGLFWESDDGTPVGSSGLGSALPGPETGGFWSSMNANAAGWLDPANGILYTLRPDAQGGFFCMTSGSGGWPSTITSSSGWMAHIGSNSNNLSGIQPGLLSQNNTDIYEMIYRFYGDTQGNSTFSPNYFADPDGMVRRGMGAFVPLGTTSSPSSVPSASWPTPADTTVGLPMSRVFNWASSGAAKPTSPDPCITLYPGTGLVSAAPTVTNPTSQAQSRPYFLHRPFYSVAELGYVFSDTPWRNLDFFTAESGNTALLDAFCINDTNDLGGLMAGKVDLNTRQASVLAAVVGGACFDPAAPTAVQIDPATALLVAKALVARTTDTANVSNGTGPLQNLSELVGRWTKNTGAGNYTPINDLGSSLISGVDSGVLASGNGFNDGKLSYAGFSGGVWDTTNHKPYANGVEDFTSPTGAPKSTGIPEDIYSAYASSTVSLGSNANHNGLQQTAAYVQRFREAPIRALAAAGTTRVWNLMIDVIAQTGRLPSSTSSTTGLANFNVEGERRYWVHVAIDRYTGKVLDEQIEEVKE